MINKSDISRRILTFPAIHPCESVSSTTILNSLYSLTSNIRKYESDHFITNKQNALEIIHLVGILSIFLKEIREIGLNHDNSALILSLSELHFVLQKVHFLLEDCAREGVRLFMLVKCVHVASLFRDLTRALAIAVDVLPFNSVRVSIDMKDSIILAMNRARDSKFDLDSCDEVALEDLNSILEKFESGFVPESSDLERILDKLGILKWSSCNKEVKFLDSELGFEYSIPEKNDLGLLSSLLGLMSHCRGVIFEEVDDNIDTRANVYNRGNHNSVVSCLNPDDFRCPISLEIMTDPVTISTGHTYDRCSISKWFEANTTCPKTGERLVNTDLVPNLALKRLISQYCFENNIQIGEKKSGRNKKRDISRTVNSGSVVAESAIRMLFVFLVNKLANGNTKEKNKAAFEIRLLTKSSIFNRSCLIESAAVPHLLDLLYSGDPLTQENSIAALLNLSKHSKSEIVENRGLNAIVHVLKEGSKIEARENAAGVLFYLSSVNEYRVLIGETPGAIRALVDLIRDGSDRGKKNGLVAIFGLIMCPENQWRVISEGLVPLLTNLLESCERENLVTDSLAVLATVAEKDEGTLAILGAGSLSVVVEIFGSITSRVGKEYCISFFLAMCKNGGGNVVRVLVEDYSLMGHLYKLLTEGNARASKKASSLIRVLHEYNERSLSSSSVRVLPQGRFVHVW